MCDSAVCGHIGVKKVRGSAGDVEQDLLGNHSRKAKVNHAAAARSRSRRTSVKVRSMKVRTADHHGSACSVLCDSKARQWGAASAETLVLF